LLCWECYFKATEHQVIKKKDFQVAKKKNPVVSKLSAAIKALPTFQTEASREKNGSAREEPTSAQRPATSAKLLSSTQTKLREQAGQDRKPHDTDLSKTKEGPFTCRDVPSSANTRGKSGRTYRSFGNLQDEEAKYMHATDNMVNYIRLKSGDKSTLSSPANRLKYLAVGWQDLSGKPATRPLTSYDSGQPPRRPKNRLKEHSLPADHKEGSRSSKCETASDLLSVIRDLKAKVKYL